MNERIKELKHQAFLWCDENIPEQYSHETGYGDAWEEKFAELILFECIKLAVFRGDKETARAIKEHFGVEE